MKKYLRLLSLFVLFFLVNDVIFAKSNAKFFASAGKVLITPQTPIPMSGYGKRVIPFKGVHDDIYARVLVMSDGTKEAVILSNEIIGISHSFWEECTASISKETGIPVEYIFLCAVHNHNGPRVGVYEEMSPEVMAYRKELIDKLVVLTKNVRNDLKPASIGVGRGESKMNINRVASNGRGGTSLGRNPYGVCDHEVSVLRVNAQSGDDPIAMLINWPCHAVCLGSKNYLISGDWPGATSEYVESAMGKGVIAPIVVGASGDINPLYGPHVDFVITESYSFGKDAIGEDVGKEALRVSNAIKYRKKNKIKASQRTILLPLKEDESRFLQPESLMNDSLLVRLSALKIGDIVLTGVSGEVFNEISLSLRKKSPFSNTFMITHCNGSSGYLITDKAYALDGYETKSTRVKNGAENAIIQNLLDMIRKL